MGRLEVLKNWAESTNVPPGEEYCDCKKSRGDARRYGVLACAANESRGSFAKVVAGNGCWNYPQQTGNDVDDGEARDRHAECAACGWNYDAKTKQKPAQQQQPILAQSNPLNDFSIRRFLRKSVFEPAASAYACGGVVQLGAKRIGCERNKSNCPDIEVAAAGQKGARDENRFAFNDDTSKQQQVTVFEE